MGHTADPFGIPEGAVVPALQWVRVLAEGGERWLHAVRRHWAGKG